MLNAKKVQSDFYYIMLVSNKEYEYIFSSI